MLSRLMSPKHARYYYAIPRLKELCPQTQKSITILTEFTRYLTYTVFLFQIGSL